MPDVKSSITSHNAKILNPPENTNEDPVKVISDTVSKELGINLDHRDISIAHRLGSKHSNTERPIICKLVRRATKSLIIHKCITLRPKLFANEHLTPPRRAMFSKLLKLKRSTSLISQLHTKDGRIYLKLKDASKKLSFSDEESLSDILAIESPFLLDCYRRVTPTGATSE